MITIKIDHIEATRFDMVNYLEHIAHLLNQGHHQGDDWKVSGIDEDDKFEPADIPEEKIPMFNGEDFE